MGRQQGQQQRDSVVAAIERVLQSERDGVEKLRRTENDAQRLLSTAREQAAAIVRRADTCISKLHAAYLQSVQQKIQTLAVSETLQSGMADASHDRTALADAARRLAAKLAGGA
jgi:vacuolar-type H+-ATPase subunit H